MNPQDIEQQLIQDFNLQDLEKGEQEELLLAVAKTIQKQFLFDVYDLIGDKSFEALQASASMGDEFYETTLKHLAPNYEDVFQKSRTKVVEAFNKKAE